MKMKMKLISALVAGMTVAMSGIGASAYATEYNTPIHSYKIAANKYRNFCPRGEESIATKAILGAETKDYYVNICRGLGRNKTLYYVGNAKNGKGYIFIPLLRAKPGFYSAVNGKYIYSLDLNQGYLRVYKTDKLILQQKVYNVRYL
jgi:hypothetical protein